MTFSPNFRGSSARGSSRQVETNYVNASGGALTKGTAVSTNLAGQIVALDVSDEDSVSRLVGITSVLIPDTATGGVVSVGRVEDITTSFAIGDAIYAGKTPGSLTNVKPDIGVSSFVAGDFVIFIGVIVKNEFNPLKKDLHFMPSVIGQL